MLLVTIGVLLVETRGHAVTFDWATIGNPGNAEDVQPQGTFGAVDATFLISTTEVTNAQYTNAQYTNAQYVVFLNAVDPTGNDLLRLYDLNQASTLGGVESTLLLVSIVCVGMLTRGKRLR